MCREALMKEFRAYVTQKFGSTVRGWYLAFDSDGRGSINWAEFATACAQCGWKEKV